MMPELPEVETVVRTLRKFLVGQTIQDVILKWPKTIEDYEGFRQKILGKTITSIERRGKYILWNLDSGTIVVHLRMEGRFYVSQENIQHKHTHAIFKLQDLDLEYHDTRKFGRIYYSPHALDELNQKLGFEPFDQNLTAAYLKEKASRRKVALKTFLLDQSVIAGIGNIYADEICFMMARSPLISVTRLRKKDFENCIQVTRSILNQAIKLGGSSVRSYSSSLGVSGRFQLQIQVYGRANQVCLRCQSILKGARVGQRSTVYCPTCQR
jgi:formamidopyrimidine-DNA glycosylase